MNYQHRQMRIKPEVSVVLRGRRYNQGDLVDQELAESMSEPRRFEILEEVPPDEPNEIEKSQQEPDPLEPALWKTPPKPQPPSVPPFSPAPKKETL